MSYADIRKRELEYIERQLADDRAMKWEMRKLFNRANTDIQDRIDAELFKLAHDEKITMADAKRLISKTDVEAFQDTAKRMAEQRDLSRRANRELRRYNVTMRTNRLEYIQARMHLSTLELAEQTAKTTERRLIEAHMQEYERQAGIFGMTLPSKERMLATARAVAFADVSGANFSDRIWADQAELREGINRAIERALIRGEHPRTASAEIAQGVRDEITNKRHKADRILITETARAQTLAQREAFKDADVEEYIYIAEGDACVVCRALDGQIFKVADMKTGVNAPFMHPFCRCSTAGHVEDLPEDAPETPETGQDEPGTGQDDPSDYREGRTVEEAKAFTIEALGESAGFTGKNIDHEMLNEYNRGISTALQVFPEISGMTDLVKVSRGKNTFAYYAIEGKEGEDGKLTPYYTLAISNLGKKEGGKKRMEEAIAKSLKTGHFVTTSTIPHVGAHEMAHAIEYKLLLDRIDKKEFTVSEWNREVINRARLGTEAKAITNAAYERIGVEPVGREAAGIRRKLGKYAATNPSELFAEAVADGIISEDPLDFSKAVVEEAKKRLGRDGK